MTDDAEAGRKESGITPGPEAPPPAHACSDPDCACVTSDDPDELRRLAEAQGRKTATTDELFRLLDLPFARKAPRRYLEKQRLIPIAMQDGTAIVATCNAAASAPELADVLGADAIEYRVVSPTDHRRLRLGIDLGEAGATSVSGRPGEGVVDLSQAGVTIDARLVALFQSILLEGIGEGASDIHLERFGQRVRVRVRIDGDLHDVEHFHLTPEQLAGVVNVVKVNANLDISERRVPQGGRMSTALHGTRFDLRVQTQPALFGEHVMLRILPQEAKPRTIESLGFEPAAARAYRRLLDAPAGLLLVVGPTGSGKTTTLYAGLQILAADATRKVVTAEDPVEYAIEDVQQSAIRPDLGFGFDQAMRAFVREDPDVVLVGEIRDPETALEALRASQTGHLVLSSLHCNDSVDAVQRLRDLGMHLNSIASELLAVLAQRLAKRNCEACTEPALPEQALAEEVFPDGVPKDFACSAGRGCAHCHGLGTRGRTAVAELLPSGPDLRRSISRGETLDELRAVALRSGLEPMREHALRLVARGTIAFSELRSLLPPERLAPDRA